MDNPYNQDNITEKTENTELYAESQLDAESQPQQSFFAEGEEAFTADTSENEYENYSYAEQSPYNKIEMSKEESYPKGTTKQSASKGLKVFAFIMALVIAATASCVLGYFLGLNNTYTSSNNNLNLAAKPDLENEYTPAEVYEMVNKSIVGIRVYNTEGKMGDASGIIYSENGYIITNDHIYSSIPAAKFKIYMHDGKEYNAKFVAGDTVSDLAVLKIDGVNNLSVAEFGDPDQMACGENVVAIGRPSDATDKTSVTSGVISLLRRRVTTTSSYSASLIQTDSAINPGSSGGALCNMYGQVIGVTASKLVATGYDSFGFAIPTTTVKRVVTQLIQHGKVIDRAKLGISYNEINSVTAEIDQLQSTGLLVREVSTDSDAVGKIKVGDIITHIDNTPITSDDLVLDIIESKKAGDKISITVVNENGISRTYQIELKANVGESSYVATTPDTPNTPDNGGGDFNFPEGE